MENKPSRQGSERTHNEAQQAGNAGQGQEAWKTLQKQAIRQSSLIPGSAGPGN